MTGIRYPITRPNQLGVIQLVAEAVSSGLLPRSAKFATHLSRSDVYATLHPLSFPSLYMVLRHTGILAY
jgi:hypothetical protein